MDFIRAMAITSVVVCHFSSFHAERIQAQKTGIFGAFGLGGYGVDLFFVLSGWLLGGILLQEIKETGRLDLKKFYRKRWLRTLPCYFAVLAATLFQRAISQKFQAADLVYISFLQTYVLNPLPFLSISWSLCVEEHFYLVIAPCLFCLRQSRLLIGVFLLFLIVVPQIFKLNGWFYSSWETHVRIDQCAFGVFLAYLRSLNQIVFSSYVKKLQPVFWFGILVILVMFFSRLTQKKIIFESQWITPIAGVFVVQSACQLSNWADLICRSRIVQYIASRSYCLYFCHVEAMFLLRRIGVVDLIVSVALFIPICLLMTELLHRLVERPFMLIKNASSDSSSMEKKGGLAQSPK